MSIKEFIRKHIVAPDPNQRHPQAQSNLDRMDGRAKPQPKLNIQIYIGPITATEPRSTK